MTRPKAIIMEWKWNGNGLECGMDGFSDITNWNSQDYIVEIYPEM